MGKKIRKSEADKEIVASRQYLTFQLGGESFAIDILDIREIIELSNLTGVPLMPAFLRGVINLRGAVVPVVDLSIRFGRKQTLITAQTCVVILEIVHEEEKQLIGMLVDAVSEVVEIADADIEPPPSFGSMLRPDFIQGMGKIGGNFVVMLNVEYVLSIDEMAMLSDMEDMHEPHE
jgi:purine-binding chemotaxis protein CheW